MFGRILALTATLLVTSCGPAAAPPVEAPAAAPVETPAAAPVETPAAAQVETPAAAPAATAPKQEPLLVETPKLGKRSFEKVYCAANHTSGSGWTIYLANYPVDRFPTSSPIADGQKVRVSFNLVAAEGSDGGQPPVGEYKADEMEGVSPRPPPTGDYVHKVRFAALEDGVEVNGWYGSASGTVEVIAVDATKLQLDVDLSGGDWTIRGNVTAARPAR